MPQLQPPKYPKTASVFTKKEIVFNHANARSYLCHDISSCYSMSPVVLECLVIKIT